MYQAKKDRICWIVSVVLIILGTLAASTADRLIENSVASTLAIIAVCVVLLGLDRGARYLVSTWLNREAEKKGDPKPFGRENML